MTVNILFFAKSRELSGINSAQITVLSQCSFTHLLENILQQYPSLSVISENIILALNEDYLSKDSDVNLQDGDEIAVIPPISGG